MNGLLIPEFDEESHSYTLNGKPLPSVTEIIRLLQNGNHYTEESRVFGSAVHKTIHYYNEGDLDESSVGESIRPYLDGWIKFRSDTGFTPDLVEKPLASERGFAGRLDAADLDIAVADIKSGAQEPSHAVQLALYASMLPNPYIRRWAVYLNDHGTYTLKEFPKIEYLSDLNVGLNCLSIWNWKARTNGGRTANC